MARPGADTSDSAQPRPKPSPAIRAQAAVWVTKLHSDDRSPQMEREFRKWQAQSPEHREAFEKTTDAWMAVGNIRMADVYKAMAAQNAKQPGGGYGAYGGYSGLSRWVAGGALAALLAVGVFVGQQWWDRGLYRTDVGEQRVVTLDDGSRMRLNTDTQVRVNFSDRQRTIAVTRGEALFEVSKDPQRPFVVRASGSEVVAVGTEFVVRYGGTAAGAPPELAVTLIEGQVNVRPAADPGADAIAPDKAIAMKAGDRLRLGRAADRKTAAVPTVDRPNVVEVTAWERNEAVFDAATLPEAVAEMNRYNRTPIVLVDELSRSNLRVSGLYHTGDSVGFANAVAHLHGLRLKNEVGRLVLEKAE